MKRGVLVGLAARRRCDLRAGARCAPIRPAAAVSPRPAPLWVDYAGHDAPITPKPGMVLAVSSGTVAPARCAQAGAATIFFDLHLNDRIGTTTAPADPATIADEGAARSSTSPYR